jgi:carbon-monoxide dehydrogenase medium subunit
MKPPPFDYFAPTSLEEALVLRSEHGDGSVMLAGGQSLIPLLSLRLALPAAVIDLGRVPGLAGITPLDGGVAVGAMTRQRELERSPLARDRLAFVVEALKHVGHVTIRNRGTVGGSIAHADPAAELPAAVLALDAQLVACSVRGERTIAAGDFFRGLYTTALEPDELLVEVRFSDAPACSRSAFIEVARREGDFALAGAGASIALNGGREIADARLVFIGVDTRPVRATEAEEALRGSEPSVEMFREIAEAAVQGLEPISDLNGTRAYRRRVAAVVARRALVAATTSA